MNTSILFIDDDERVLSSFERIVYPFRKEWKCEFISDPEIALERLNTDAIDIVVTDVKMPKINGLELLEKIKSDPITQDIEVIVVTGVGDRNYKKQALDLNATDLLNKPISNEELVSRIRNAVKVKSYRDELIAKNKTLEEQLVSIQKMEVIGILSGGAVHDLNSILGIIQGYGNMILKQDIQSGTLKNDFNVIMESVERAMSITKQIHSFSNISNHTHEVVILENLLSEMKTSLSITVGKNTTILVKVDNPACAINAPIGLVYQVFMNLCINAIQAMDGNGQLEIRARTLDDKKICVEFEDSGGGIDTSIQKIIFEPLFTTKRKTGGSGLGLAIVRKLMTQLKGDVQVRNGSKGAIFSLFFPPFR